MKKSLLITLTAMQFFISSFTWANSSPHADLAFKWISSNGMMHPCSGGGFWGCTLVIPPVQSAMLQVTNTASFTALAITAFLPPSLSDITFSTTGCDALAPGASCTIIFNSSNTIHPSTQAYIQGTNTNPAYFNIVVA
jgi:hypothetical protein